MIIQNQVECLLCGDKPYSTNRHDFRSCKCGNVSVDGGMDYLRRVFNKYHSFKELSIELPDAVAREAIAAIIAAKTTNRNELGILCATLRSLRDNGYVVSENVPDTGPDDTESGRETVQDEVPPSVGSESPWYFRWFNYPPSE